MIKITQKEVVYNTIKLSNKNAREVCRQYLQNTLGINEYPGDECYISPEGRLKHWTSFPHGSGTTTDLGVPTELQLLAYEVIKRLQ